MDITNKDITPHPQLLDLLFAHKHQIKPIFAEILNRYDIDHIAVTSVNRNRELLTFSSTPAIEFNLFNSGLWHLDNTYQSAWFEKCVAAPWQSLYSGRYDELYYLKQLKHHYSSGYSFATKVNGAPLIYSVASQKNTLITQDSIKTIYDIFDEIGQYCNQLILPLLSTVK